MNYKAGDKVIGRPRRQTPDGHIGEQLPEQVGEVVETHWNHTTLDTQVHVHFPELDYVHVFYASQVRPA